MNLKDRHDLTLSGTDAAAVQAFDAAARQFLLYRGDPVATLGPALATRPDFVMGQVLMAYLHLLGTEPGGIEVARAALAQAQDAPATARERGHLEAARHMVEGQWQAASRVLEDIAIAWPRDLLALQAGHIVDFLRGDSRMLRDHIARALPAWSPSMPDYHGVLGLLAFGLEECGHYAAAEAAGREAVEREPGDAWAVHAVAHVMEMQDRRRDGIDWLRASEAHWAPDNFFAVHTWWHLALYHLGRDEVDAALALFDGPVHGARSGLALDLVDASALLWRLMLRGIDLGERWQSVAEAWLPLASAGNYAFNDVHALMAFASAGREDAVQAVLEAQERALRGSGDNAGFVHEVGAPLGQAVLDFAQGDYARCVERLRAVRPVAQRFGGSHAQRDLVDLTLIEAARRAGRSQLEAALRAERAEARGARRLAWEGGAGRGAALRAAA